MEVTKECNKCKKVKVSSEFNKHKTTIDKLCSWCTSCHRAASKEWAEKNKKVVKKRSDKWYKKFKIRHKNNTLLRKYGITVEQYNEMLVKQNGKCKICDNAQLSGNQWGRYNLVVDHCHKTNIVRGLLCSSCNRGIGLMKESINSFKNAIIYLEEFKNEKS